MAQWLGVSTVLPEDQSLFLSTHIGCLTTIITQAPCDLTYSSGLLYHCTHVYRASLIVLTSFVCQLDTSWSYHRERSPLRKYLHEIQL